MIFIVKAKFHNAIQVASWFEAGSKLVAGRFEAGRKSAASWNFAYHLPC